MKRIAVLFAQEGSIYNEFTDCDVYDKARDATTYPRAFALWLCAVATQCH